MTCPACGFADSEFVFVESWPANYQGWVLEYEILRCPECKSEFAEPRRSAPPEWYSEGREFYGWRWEFERFIDDLGNFVRLGKNSKIMEIGCGEGILLERLNGRYKVWGIDFNEEAIRVARAKGLRVFPMTSDVFSAKNPELKFDVVAFFHLIEHLENPLEFLKDVLGILNPNGFLFLSIPNPNRCMLKIGREDWDYPPHHLTRFSKIGIKRLLERAGFQVLRDLNQPVEDDVIYRLKIDPYKRLPLPTFIREIIKLPFFILLQPYGLYLRKTYTGQSFYLVARC